MRLLRVNRQQPLRPVFLLVILGAVASCDALLTYENLKAFNTFQETVAKISSSLVVSSALVGNYSNSTCDELYAAYPVDESWLDSQLIQANHIDLSQTDEKLLDFVLSGIFSSEPFLYSKVLLVSTTGDNYYSNESFYQKCGLYYSCNFQVDFILLNSTCAVDMACAGSTVESYLSRIESKYLNESSANVTYFNDFACIDESGWLILVYGNNDTMADYIFQRIQINILSYFIPFKLFDILLVNVQTNQVCRSSYNQAGVKQYFKYKQTSELILVPAVAIPTGETKFLFYSDNSMLKNASFTFGQVHDYDLNLTYAFDSNTLIVLAVQNEPFIFKNSQGQWDGFCVDILTEASRELNLSFLIKEMSSCGDIFSSYVNGTSSLVYKWSGAIGDLLDDQGDLIAGKLAIDSIKSYFLDFSTPFYSEDGIVFILKKSTQQYQLFIFVNVFTWQLWLCLFGYIILTSMTMFFLDKTRPLSAKEKDFSRSFQYNFVDSIWFTIGAFTLAGGVHPPKALSVKILFASFWFFSAITISTYIANLAAFLTVSNLGTTTISIKDLANQVAIGYTTIENSDTLEVLTKLKDLEDRFLTLWKDVSLGVDTGYSSNYDSLLKSYAIYDYPLTDVFSRLWDAMNSTGFAATTQDGITLVLNSTSDAPLGLLIDYSLAKYLQSSTCSFDIYADKLAKRSYGFGFKKNSGFKNSISEIIMKMKKSGQLDSYKDKWWKGCENNPNEFSSITLDTIGGSFIALLAGIVIVIPFQAVMAVLRKKFQKPNPVNEDDMPVKSI